MARPLHRPLLGPGDGPTQLEGLQDEGPASQVVSGLGILGEDVAHLPHTGQPAFQSRPHHHASDSRPPSAVSSCTKWTREEQTPREQLPEDLADESFKSPCKTGQPPRPPKKNAKTKKTNSSKSWQGSYPSGTFLCCWGERKGHDYVGESFGTFC